MKIQLLLIYKPPFLPSRLFTIPSRLPLFTSAQQGVITANNNKMLAKVVKQVKGHGSQISDDLGEIYKVLPWRHYIVSLALDSYIKIWDHDLQLVSAHLMTGYNLISLACDHDHFYLGDGHGSIRIFDEQFHLQKTLKICEDNISDIKIIGDLLVAVAFDGTIAKVDLNSFHMITTNVEGQLSQISLLNGAYYVAGTRSYRLELDLSHPVELERANHFIGMGGDVFGVSDNLGFFNLTKNCSTFEPTDIVAVSGQQIIGVSESGITVYTWSETGLSWKTQALPFQFGYQKRGLIVEGKEVIVGGDDGRLYKLHME